MNIFISLIAGWSAAGLAMYLHQNIYTVFITGFAVTTLAMQITRSF